MEPESEIDAVLIDAFDAEPAPVYRPAAAPQQQIPTSGRMEASGTSAPVGALRHYPSLDSLASPLRSTGTQNTTPHQAPVSSSSHTIVAAPTPIMYPRWATDKTDVAHVESERQITQTSANDRDRMSTQYHPRLHYDPERTSGTATPGRQAVQLSARTPQEHEPPAQVRSHSSREPRTVPTNDEIARQQRLLQAEVHRFEQQADYMALALAGETPHQIEQRRQREEERKAREQRRLVAMETRALNTSEREQQRLARQEERRLRHTERTHQSSRSPSPEPSGEDEVDDGDHHPTDSQC